jgi:hypothetical protein
MENKTATSLQTKLARLEQRHRALIAELTEIGLVLRGSIAARKGRCGQPTCRCHRDPEALHGPYHMWTRKRAGKTVTVVLSPEQSALCQQWTQNMRRLDRTVRALQELGLRAADAVRSAK